MDLDYEQFVYFWGSEKSFGCQPHGGAAYLGLFR